MALPQRIASLRTRGYVFEKDIENQAQAFVESWALLYPNLQSQINMQSSALVNSIRPIEMQMTQLTASASNPSAARGLLGSMQSAVNMLEDKVSAIERTIEGMYDQFNNQVSRFTQHLTEIEYLVTQLAEATFQLLPTEGGIAAIKAVWCKTGKEQKGDPEGVLYLTDQRILFEQKEEIVTKKVLFVATEKQKVQQLQIECPVILVDKVETSKQGLLKNEDHIEIRFASGAAGRSGPLPHLAGQRHLAAINQPCQEQRFRNGHGPWQLIKRRWTRLRPHRVSAQAVAGISPRW